MIVDSLEVAADDPCLNGHFPGHPLVPGVVILDAVIASASAHYGAVIAGVDRCKFRQPLRPERACRIEIREVDDAALRFVCTEQGDEIATGRLLLSRPFNTNNPDP